MANTKFLLISLEDERAKHLSNVLSNKTCKKIIDLLADNEFSENDLANKLNQPINTIEYNLKKLVQSGIVEKSQNWFWSSKGKKIIMYKLSNKSIVISPKKTSIEKLKKIFPVTLIFSLATIFIGILTTSKKTISDYAGNEIMLTATKASEIVSPGMILDSSTFPTWAWFLFGWISAIIVYSIINWRKI